MEIGIVIEKRIAQILHDSWREKKLDMGFHLPEKCPSFEESYDDDGNLVDPKVIHCRKCLPDLVEYSKLTKFKQDEYKKEAQKLIDNFEKNGLIVTLRD